VGPIVRLYHVTRLLRAKKPAKNLKTLQKPSLWALGPVLRVSMAQRFPRFFFLDCYVVGFPQLVARRGIDRWRWCWELRRIPEKIGWRHQVKVMSTPAIYLGARTFASCRSRRHLFCGPRWTFFVHHLLLVQEDYITVGIGTTALSFPFQTLFPSIRWKRRSKRIPIHVIWLRERGNP
jgi:hypothetical protein